MNPINAQASTKQVIEISRCDRWFVYQRLQELAIPCECLSDGSFQVNVQTPDAAIQVYSVIRQFTASRKELVKWLHRCWQAD